MKRICALDQCTFVTTCRGVTTQLAFHGYYMPYSDSCPCSADDGSRERNSYCGLDDSNSCYYSKISLLLPRILH